MTNTDEDSFIKITGIVSKLYFEELMDGRESFHDVEWDIEEYDEDAPPLLEEVKELQAWKKLVSDIVQQHDGSQLREMLKELIV